MKSIEVKRGFTPGVVPLVGTWIEIIYKTPTFTGGTVVPLVGTWIEIWR